MVKATTSKAPPPGIPDSVKAASSVDASDTQAPTTEGAPEKMSTDDGPEAETNVDEKANDEAASDDTRTSELARRKALNLQVETDEEDTNQEPKVPSPMDIPEAHPPTPEEVSYLEEAHRLEEHHTETVPVQRMFRICTTNIYVVLADQQAAQSGRRTASHCENHPHLGLP